MTSAASRPEPHAAKIDTTRECAGVMLTVDDNLLDTRAAAQHCGYAYATFVRLRLTGHVWHREVGAGAGESWPDHVQRLQGGMFELLGDALYKA